MTRINKTLGHVFVHVELLLMEKMEHKHGGNSINVAFRISHNRVIIILTIYKPQKKSCLIERNATYAVHEITRKN